MASKFKKLMCTGSRKTQHKYENDFINASSREDMGSLRKLMKDKIKILAPISWKGHTRDEYVYAIHIGCATGSLEVVKYLFRMGCSLETKTDSGLSPLHFAAMYNIAHPEVTGHLIDMGAKSNVTDKLNGFTPLQCACKSNNYGAVKVLLNSTSGQMTDSLRKKARGLACNNGCERIVELFEDFEQQQKNKELLSKLPERISILERQTEFLLQQYNNTVARGILVSRSRNNSYSKNGDLYATNSSPNLLCVEEPVVERTRHASGPAVAVNSVLQNSYSTCGNAILGLQNVNSNVTQATVGNGYVPNSSSPMGHVIRPLSNVDTLRHVNSEPLTRNSSITDLHKKRILKKYSFLCTNMKPDKVIIKLLTKGHIDLNTKVYLSQLPTDFSKNEYLISKVLLKGTIGLYNDVIQSLKATEQPHIAETLKIPTTKSHNGSHNSV